MEFWATRDRGKKISNYLNQQQKRTSKKYKDDISIDLQEIHSDTGKTRVCYSKSA